MGYIYNKVLYMYACMHACMYVCIYVCMYVCMLHACISFGIDNTKNIQGS